MDKPGIKRLKRAAMEKLKTSRNTLLKTARHDKKPVKQGSINRPEKVVVHQTLGPSDLPVPPLDRLRPSPTHAPEAPEPPKAEDEKEAIGEARFSDRGHETPSTPEAILHGAKYAYVSKPEYPEQARRGGWEGTVLLAILVDAEGRPKRIVVSRSSGFGVLDRAAEETVKRWRFQPAHYGKTRVQSWVKVPIVFTLAQASNR